MSTNQHPIHNGELTMSMSERGPLVLATVLAERGYNGMHSLSVAQRGKLAEPGCYNSTTQLHHLATGTLSLSMAERGKLAETGSNNNCMQRIQNEMQILTVAEP